MRLADTRRATYGVQQLSRFYHEITGVASIVKNHDFVEFRLADTSPDETAELT